MVTLQIQQLNSTTQITSRVQQQVHGGGAKELLRGYGDGIYRVEKSGQQYQFVDGSGNQVGTLINKGGYNFFIQNGNVEAVKDGNVDSTLNVNTIF